MDLTAPLKTEVIRPLVTLVVPGTIATGPFVLLLGDYVPEVSRFWNAHPTAFATLIVLAILAAGFIIEDLGTLIESWWDIRLQRRNSSHDEIWKKYLQLQLKDELVGQRYLRTRVTVLKFELAMSVALIMFWIGLLWLQARHSLWSFAGFVFVSFVVLAGAASLLWGSWKTSCLLSETHALIVDAIERGPQGIASARAPGQ